jgi:hypothetical protein
MNFGQHIPVRRCSACIAAGAIPAGSSVRQVAWHLCDNPQCVKGKKPDPEIPF